MTHDEAKAKAEELWNNWAAGTQIPDRFVRIVKQTLLAATQAERKRCGKLARDWKGKDDGTDRWISGQIAAAIEADDD